MTPAPHLGCPGELTALLTSSGVERGRLAESQPFRDSALRQPPGTALSQLSACWHRACDLARWAAGGLHDRAPCGRTDGACAPPQW
jgi:hypothetical protein